MQGRLVLLHQLPLLLLRAHGQHQVPVLLMLVQNGMRPWLIWSLGL
jgi:hypothetical protein